MQTNIEYIEEEPIVQEAPKMPPPPPKPILSVYLNDSYKDVLDFNDYKKYDDVNVSRYYKTVDNIDGSKYFENVKSVIVNKLGSIPKEMSPTKQIDY